MKSLEAQVAALEATFTELADVLGREQFAWPPHLPTLLEGAAREARSTAERIEHLAELAGRMRH